MSDALKTPFTDSQARHRHQAERLFYRPAEAAAATGLSLRTVWRRIESGPWRSIVDGGTRLILAQDVEHKSGLTRPPV